MAPTNRTSAARSGRTTTLSIAENTIDDSVFLRYANKKWLLRLTRTGSSQGTAAGGAAPDDADDTTDLWPEGGEGGPGDDPADAPDGTPAADDDPDGDRRYELGTLTMEEGLKPIAAALGLTFTRGTKPDLINAIIKAENKKAETNT